MGQRVIGGFLSIALMALGAGGAGAAVPCDTNADCTGDEACIGGGCVPPVADLKAYGAQAALRWSSYWWAVQFPALFDPAEVCCFDLDGDGTVDDAFGTTLALAAPLLTTSPQTQVDGAIENGTLVAVMDWRELVPDLTAGDVQVSVFEGRINDGASFADRRAGLGHYLLETSSFGTHGALSQLNSGSVASGIIAVQGNQLVLPLFLPNGVWATTPLDEPRLEVDVEYDDDPGATCRGLCSVDEDRGAGHHPRIVGGARIGGFFHAEDMYSLMDSFFRTCSCAGVDPNQSVVVWGPANGAIRGSCTANTGDPALCPPDDPCYQLDQICAFLPLMGDIMDIDRDNDGVIDSMSAGFRVGWSGAAVDGITPEIFVDGFESGDVGGWDVTVP